MPPTGEPVQVRFASLDQPVALQDRLVGWCSPAEHERAARLRRPDAARERLVARGLLRTILAERLGGSPHEVALTVGENGKPRLAGSPPALRFSLSHSAGLVAVCLHPSSEVGIDVEHRARPLDVDVLARTVLDPEEAARVTAAGAARREVFLRLWTRREALGKAAGRGLDWQAGGPAARAWLTAAPAGDGWSVHDVDAPAGFLAAVAVAADPDVSPPAPGTS
jgi:4'-phosphopantetheinyl transferase